jgi:hypothetical protein
MFPVFWPWPPVFVHRQLEKDEATGLISVLLNYKSLIDGALPPQKLEEKTR